MKKIGFGIVLSIMAIFMASCSLNGTENAYIGVYPNSLQPKAIAGRSSFKIYHTHALTLGVDKSGEGWCTISPESVAAPTNGYDSTVITVNFTANTTDKARFTEVWAKSGDLESYVVIKQETNIPQ